MSLWSGARRYLPLVLFAGLWELVTRTAIVNPEILPPLSAICKAWLALAMSGDLVYHGTTSLMNLAVGLALAVVVGIVVGILMGRSQIAEDLFGPLVNAIYPLPKPALIPILIMWFGLGSGSKIATIFIGCLTPIVMSAYNGARGVDRLLIWSALSSGASRLEVLWDVVFPAALPEILSGLRNALGLAFILLVASELLIGQRGLGYLISFLGEGGLYAGMFAGVLTVTALGFLCDRLYLILADRVLAWQR